MGTESIDEMKEQLKLCSDSVIKNTKIVTPGDLIQDYLLHISIEKIPEFIPYVSKRAALSEDNTVARIHTCPTLGGCLVGFSMSDYLTNNLIPSSDGKNKNKSTGIRGTYLGGLYIHKIPFEVALKPNKKLVFDSEKTDETWLITYNEQTRKYPAKIVGKMVLSKLEVEPELNKLPSNTTVFMVEIEEDEDIYLTSGIVLGEGYWELRFNNTTFEMTYKKIDKDKYELDKRSKANMLSFKEPPAYHKW